MMRQARQVRVMRFLLFLAVALVAILSSMIVNVQAQDVFDEASRRYSIPKPLLLAIAKTESSLHPWIVNVAGRDFRLRTREEAIRIIRAAKARGLSHDVGLMQINNWWLDRLHIAPETALEPRNNAILGAWILAQEIRRHGYTWKAVAAYHSPNPERGRRYATVVLGKYRSQQ